MNLIILISVIYVTAVNGQFSPIRIIFENLHEEPPVSPPVYRNNINMNYIEQKLDHFDAKENRTWQMRYLSNDFYFKSNGPIFIFVGGEWTISEGNLRGGHMFDMTKSLNGYLFYTEHRFYGRSQPFPDLKTEHLKFLSVKQSLADLAHFIQTVKATIPGLQQSKVILVGGSYSATMVTWFSKLYPELVNGAWASSAPLRAKVDFIEYEEVVGESITEVGGEACYKRIENAIKIIEEEVNNHSLDKIKSYVNICRNFDTQNKMDVMSLFGSISGIFSGIVQRHNKGNIESACAKIMEPSDDLVGFGNFMKSYFAAESQCADMTYQASVEELKKTDVKSEMRSWYYQTCNEFGWYQTSGSDHQPFGKNFPLEFYLSLCQDVYDMGFSAENIELSVQKTNAEFGELQPEVKNVFFTHGKLDPWHAMGLLCSDECGAVVPLYAHCKDLASSSESDTDEMMKLKMTVFELVRKWIS